MSRNFDTEPLSLIPLVHLRELYARGVITREAFIAEIKRRGLLPATVL